ncbi:MAG: hypothetical protein LAO21_01030 [Acidobacteriia bacterium]|nr:hypothetical protein [Terriglobia bacterium]
MLPFLLYLTAGVVTGVPVLYALGWAVWGAPISTWKYVSLLGSLVLVFSAYVSLVRAHAAARLALVGAIMVWSFYLPGIIGLTAAKLSDQRLTIRIMKWSPSDEPLVISDSLDKILGISGARLSNAEIAQLKGIGIGGSVENCQYSFFGKGKSSRAIIIMSHPVPHPVDLPEPNATNIIYVQYGQEWKRYPLNAATLKRTIRLEPIWEDPRQSMLKVELASGARQGYEIDFQPKRDTTGLKR